MNWLSDKWLEIRNRPLAILGVILAGFIILFALYSTVDTTKRIFVSDQKSPCDNRTIEECALLFYTSLSPEKRKAVLEDAARQVRAQIKREAAKKLAARQALLRQQRIRRAAQEAGGCSPGCSSTGGTSPTSGTGQSGSSAKPKPNPSQKPSSGSGSGNSGGGNSGGSMQQPPPANAVVTPSISVLGVVTVPSIAVSCPMVLGRNLC